MVQLEVIIIINLKLNNFLDVESQPAGRMLAAELLAKLQSDKLTSGKWQRLMAQFLPTIFADTLRDNPSKA